MLDSWVISHASNSIPRHDEDRLLPFLNLERIPPLPLEVYLPFPLEATLIGIEQRENEVWMAG